MGLEIKNNNENQVNICKKKMNVVFFSFNCITLRVSVRKESITIKFLTTRKKREKEILSGFQVIQVKANFISVVLSSLYFTTFSLIKFKLCKKNEKNNNL